MEQTNSFAELGAIFANVPHSEMLFALLLLIVLAAFANFVVKRLLVKLLHELLRLTRFGNDPEIMRHDVVARIANIVPALIIITGINAVPDLPETVIAIIRNVTSAFIILTFALAIDKALNIVNTVYMRRPDAASKPIKGYIQVIKILLSLLCGILIIATLLDKSPLILLSGLGAMAAVLMLVFQDTLLSLVASVQISSSDMVRVGDWIEHPQMNADGEVIDVALHTVKVQNWDKTITTIPTRRLVSDPFKNWRGMQESGGRRMKRAIFLDQTSIHFLSDEERQNLKRFKLLRDYLGGKEQELNDWNAKIGEEKPETVNLRRLTNIGTFRAYVRLYLEQHPNIRGDMTQIVRQLSPSPAGLPIEIYCFTNTTAWAAYEGIQSDIFDHLYAILPEFGLRAYQQPGSGDIQNLEGFLLSRMQMNTAQ